MAINRRNFLGLPALASLGFSQKISAKQQTPTPPEGEGPFYPVVAQADQDFDLTIVKGKSGVAQGEIVFVEGQVLQTDGTPIPNVTIDMWQANTHGRYRHPFDQSDQPLDENFQGWAIIQSGEQGGFRFKTIMPGAYGDHGWIRPPHLHFKISKQGYFDLSTQMYFDGQTLNEKDLLLQRKRPDEQATMIAKSTQNSSNGEKIYQYNIVLKKV